MQAMATAKPVQEVSVWKAREIKRAAAKARDKQLIEWMEHRIKCLEAELRAWEEWLWPTAHHAHFLWHRRAGGQDACDDNHCDAGELGSVRQGRLSEGGGGQQQQQHQQQCRQQQASHNLFDYSKWDKMAYSSDGEEQGEDDEDGYGGLDSHADDDDYDDTEFPEETEGTRAEAEARAEEGEDSHADGDGYDTEFLEEAEGTRAIAEARAGEDYSADGDDCDTEFLEEAEGTTTRAEAEARAEEGEEGYSADTTAFALCECCNDNQETLLRLLDHSKQILDECMRATADRFSQMEMPRGMLAATEDLCQQQYGAYREMITQVSIDQFSRQGTVPVLNLVDRWRDDWMQRLARIGIDELETSSQSYVDG